MEQVWSAAASLLPCLRQCLPPPGSRADLAPSLLASESEVSHMRCVSQASVHGEVTHPNAEAALVPAALEGVDAASSGVDTASSLTEWTCELERWNLSRSPSASTITTTLENYLEMIEDENGFGDLAYRDQRNRHFATEAPLDLHLQWLTSRGLHYGVMRGVPCWPFMWTGPPPFWMVPFNREWQSPALTTILVTVTATHNFKNWGCQSADNRRNLNWSRISSCDGQCRITFSLMSGVHLKMSRHVLESWGRGEISLQQLKIFVLHEALIAGNNQYVPRRAVDGHFYSYSEFADYYFDATGRCPWHHRHRDFMEFVGPEATWDPCMPVSMMQWSLAAMRTWRVALVAAGQGENSEMTWRDFQNVCLPCCWLGGLKGDEVPRALLVPRRKRNRRYYCDCAPPLEGVMETTSESSCSRSPSAYDSW